MFFPDPWHKKRHNKRRLIQPEFVAKLIQHIAPGGYLHCATDWQPYAEQMLEVLSAQPHLLNTAAAATGYADKPAYRPLTKFENRGIKLGHAQEPKTDQGRRSAPDLNVSGLRRSNRLTYCADGVPSR